MIRTLSWRFLTSFRDRIRAKKLGDSRPLEEVAMNKSEFLKGLREEYQQWEALLNQIGEERMDQSGVA